MLWGAYPLLLLHLLLFLCTAETRWIRWWDYSSGLDGPDYWGMTNPEWRLCRKGQQQSPINIEPSRLLFDPNLKHVQVEATLMKGQVTNTGYDFTVDLLAEGYSSVNISLGPLSYRYRAAQIKFHFGNVNSLGSEHHIDGKAFPAEMHVLGYNIDLYENFTQALTGGKGIVVLAVFLDVGKETNNSFSVITDELRRLRKKDSRAMAHNIDLKQLLPQTQHYITYDGSLTQPGCYETVTWILYNKPAIISDRQLSDLRVLYTGWVDGAEMRNGESSVEVASNPMMVIKKSNARPIMPLNHRVVRTNINTKKRSRLCSMERDMYYQVNEIYLKT